MQVINYKTENLFKITFLISKIYCIILNFYIIKMTLKIVDTYPDNGAIICPLFMM